MPGPNENVREQFRLQLGQRRAEAMQRFTSSHPVVKALDDQTIATDLVSGASILGDGRVVLVLNLAAVVERYSKARPADAGDVASGLLLSHSTGMTPRNPPEVRQ